ncbi:MAG: carboxypeptidase regulatory-like domain-containing protein [Terriglobia bacterium]
MKRLASLLLTVRRKAITGKAGMGLLLLIGLGAAPLARGQAVANAQIHGAVADPSGAVVPNAQVKVTQTTIGMSRTTVSNAAGTYVLPNLPVGPYTFEVSARGFTQYVQSGIVLHVGDNVALNVTLKVGKVSQQVVVQSNANMVQTQNTSVSEVIDNKRMLDLPLNGRLATQLVILSGAALNSPVNNDYVSTKNYPNSAVISVAGGQGNENNYLLDGADNNDSMTDVNLPYPFPDALQEFSVETNGLSAKYGYEPGMVMNAVTKSGTNQFHGDLFEFVRNGAFNARNYFAPTQDTLRRNQFGGTIGGPIKKNKLFFFFGYQSTRNRTAPPTTISFVPTPSVLGGDFSAIESAQCTSSHKAVSLINPANGQPFANDFIPPSLFNPQALNLLKYIPVSSNACGEEIYSVPAPNNESQYIGRADWTINSKQSFYARYFILNYDAPVSFNGHDLLPTSQNALHQRSQALVLSHTYSLTPATVNNVLASWTRLRDDRGPAPGLPTVADFGVNDFQLSPGFISVNVENYFNVCNCGAPGDFNRNVLQLSDDVDSIDGRHQITYGGEWIHNQFNEYNVFEGDPAIAFDGSFTGSALADFMLGDMNTFTQGGAETHYERQNYFGLYAQDDVHLSSRLNFHVGLRWEPMLPPVDKSNRGSDFLLPAFETGKKSTVFVNAPAGLFFYGDPGIPRGYYFNSLADVEPRVGFAWSPTGKGNQSIRASYSIFDWASENFYPDRFSDAAPWASTITLTDPVGGFTNPWLGYPGGDPLPFPFPPSKDFVFPHEGVYIDIPENMPPAYMQQWDLSYQRQLGHNWMVSATYIGNHSVHIWGAIEEDPGEFLTVAQCATVGISASTCQTDKSLNQRRRLNLMNPTEGSYYSTMAEGYPGDSGSYNGLLLSTEHRFSQNYTVLFNYTYSHCLDMMDNGGELSAPLTQNPNDPAADYGNCGFNLTHNLNASLVARMPTFRGLWVNRLFGNWQLSPIVTYNSGLWFSPTTGTDRSLTGVGLDRPDLVGNSYVRNTTTRLWLNPAAYIPNPLGTFGNAGRDSLEGPGYSDIDADLSRFFQMPWNESQRMELRFEFFNLGNNVNFKNPTSSLKSSQFGEILAADDPRILQFALKYYF